MMMKYNSQLFRLTAKTLFAVLALELVSPAMRTYALTSGPSQPEVQSFEPVGTTDMVDLFSGDFVYNIPLLDVEGYPINIAYHSGTNVEDEASWVGLGWNINPGVINRSVRGIPDDFSGEKIQKELHIKDETTVGLSLGAEFELFGLQFLRGGVGNSITYNNYKGMGVGFDAGLKLNMGYLNTGLGVSVGSQEGASADVNAGLNFATNTSDGGSVSGSVYGGTGFNTRSGMKDISYGANIAVSESRQGILKQSKWAKLLGLKPRMGSQRITTGGISFNSYVPIGMKNYVSSITNASSARAISFSAGVGLEVVGGYPHFRTNLFGSLLHHESDGSRSAFGYLYLEQANEQSIMDFSREKDGVYNATLPNLPFSSMTYDLFSISGQGTGGMFRPFRNDIGTVYDPKITSDQGDFSSHVEAGIGSGFGGLFEIGTNVNMTYAQMNAGPWKRRPFQAKAEGSLFENFYFKQAGEMTNSNIYANPAIAGKEPVRADADMNLYNKQRASVGALPRFTGNHEDRNSRANNMSFFTNKEAAVPGVAIHQKIERYPRNQFTGAPTVAKDDRLTNTDKIDGAKANHIGEISQVLPDGRRYVYGIAAKNNVQREVTFSVDNVPSDAYTSGIIGYDDLANSMSNNKGRDHYYQSSVTPAFTHSYLLTDVFSADYVDITGDGPTEDDLGGYTKVNYSRTSADFRWRTPYERPGAKAAQFSPGYYSDKGDDKANYIVGSKEMWYIHSIESKNYIAEFYTSPRKDGMGYKGGLGVSNVSGNIGTDGDQQLYRLDSIKLFSKRDRFINGTNATAIKTVVLVYEENAANQLCQGIPNYTGTNSGIGKLTLKRIYFKFGNSNRSLLNPYEFNYSSFNPAYDFLAKDRWGNYKPVVPGISNYEFPYVDQNKTNTDNYASAWQLTQVKLPSGGTIDVQYESDDYSYVQDKRAMELLKVAGVGSDKNYVAKSMLYEDEQITNNYIYFKRDRSREIPGRSLKENYLPEDDLLYFSFFVDIGNKNSYEPIKAYAKVEEIDSCQNNSDYGYIKVKQEKAGSSTEQLMNPITLAALNIGRYYLPHIIYPGYTDGDLNVSQTIKGMVAATEELFTIAQNPNIRFMKRGLGKAIDISRSRIRVNTPGFTKLGGGSRVKRLEFSDGWDQMTATGASSVVGKEYNYTMTDPSSGKAISSGVANYEPMIGGDENPCRKPVYYSGDGGRLLPAVQLFQEEPLGESFYPGGAVGYSKVTVSSIHRQTGAASKGIDEYEFYTTKDFPYYVDKTAINTDDKFQSNKLVHRVDRLSVSQGYTLVLNDMHGKSKAISNYVQKGNNRELISSVKYTYQLNSKGQLENTVKAIDRGTDPYAATFGLSNRTLGQEVDITVDSRERTNTSLTVPVNFNLNVLFFAPVAVVPVPTVFSPVKMEENIFRTSTVSKVVQQYGILKSTEVIDHGAKTITDNVVFDAESGQVVVTKTNNEYNDPVTNVSYPAYWMYPGMGGSYATLGYITTADSLYVDSFLNGYIMGPHGLDVFTEGDELLVTDQQGNNYNLWVDGRDTCPNYTPGGNQTIITGVLPGSGVISYKPSGLCCATKVVPRALYPNGDNQTWRPRKSALKNVSIKIIRSGRKNQLAAMVQSITMSGGFTPTTFADLFNNSLFSGKILSASGSRFINSAEEDQIDGTPWGATYWFNSFIRGLKGSYKPLDGYAFLSGRDYTNEHARKNGTMTSYYSLWLNPNGFGLSGCDDISLKYKSLFNWSTNSDWKKQSQVTKYGNGGVALEEQDAAGIYSTALFSYGGDLPVAVAQNARYRQVRYLSFDDLFSLYNGRRHVLGRYTGTLKPVVFPSFADSYYGRTFGLTSTGILGSGLSLVSDGHSGQYALQFSGGQINVGAASDFGVSTRYYVSAWVKSATVPTANSLSIVGTTGGTPQSYYPFTKISSPVEGWYKLEGYLTIPNKDFLTLTGASGIIMDDFRICPDKANMKSFVYDPLTLRLFAQLDENNYATFYEYDAEGKLVRTKKETDKGILTLSESRMSAAK
jgi:hypothetical protein